MTYLNETIAPFELHFYYLIINWFLLNLANLSISTLRIIFNAF